MQTTGNCSCIAGSFFSVFFLVRRNRRFSEDCPRRSAYSGKGTGGTYFCFPVPFSKVDGGHVSLALLYSRIFREALRPLGGKRHATVRRPGCSFLYRGTDGGDFTTSKGFLECKGTRGDGFGVAWATFAACSFRKGERNTLRRKG